jgi:uncharacterized membrane protein/predicted DsbA family dithiol-disulfide isomerase
LALLLALAASAALAVDYLSSNPSFCGARSGCGVVRRSGWGYVGPISVPQLGIASFAGVLLISLRAAWVRLAAIFSIVGAVVALALIAVQAFVIDQFCWLCLVVDISAIVAGAAGATMLVRGDWEATNGPITSGPLRAWAWSLLAVVAVSAPSVWPLVRPAGDLPSGVRERHVAGKINVVEFVDFQCPFCRMFHPTLQKVVKEYGDRVHFVRLDLPLESHAHARGAAKAHLCADEQGAGDRMADALFEAENLERAGLVASARGLGLDLGRFEACLSAEATEKKLKGIESILVDSGMLQGLPTTFVGNVMIVGARDDVALRDAFEHAARGDDASGIPGSAYVAMLLALVALIAWFGRSARSSAPSASAEPSLP